MMFRILNLLSGKYPKSPNITYSYDCEDLILKKIVDKYIGTYVDVGAHDPQKHSNTYLLYKNGWRGINIDANPYCIAKFKKYRKHDINVNVGIGLSENELDYYISDNTLLSSFDRCSVERAKLMWGFNYSSIKMRTATLKSVLDSYLKSEEQVDLLNIDVEGLEMDVLMSNDWAKYSPKWVVVELHERYIEDVLKSTTYNFLKSKEYKLVSKTFITLIFEK